jgi:hypothetical protein
MPRTDPRDMAKAIVRYDAEATKILQAFINTVEAKKPPPVLYHYTNDVGLAGIVERGQLWFSDIFGAQRPFRIAARARDCDRPAQIEGHGSAAGNRDLRQHVRAVRSRRRYRHRQRILRLDRNRTVRRICPARAHCVPGHVRLELANVILKNAI